MARKKEEKKSVGRISLDKMRSIVNSGNQYGNVAFDLRKTNPTTVTEWIPTGSRWLDSIICKGKITGIPIGKIVEIAGLEASGKSFMAACIAANAQKMGIDVIYFDSESALDPTFLELAGVDLEKILYVQAASVEMVLGTIEQLLKEASSNKMLFIWDSIAFTPAVSDIEGDFNPQSSMAVKARVFGKGLPKITQPLANGGHTLICLNQLKANIDANPMAMKANPWFTPGGKALTYAYSLRIWLTGLKGKKTYLEDEKGFRIGSQVICRLKKSRFGSEGRQCTFKIKWGTTDEVGICDEESWLEAIQSSKKYEGGTWKIIKDDDGYEKKFQEKSFVEFVRNDPEFRKRVMKIMDEEVVRKFEERDGTAKDFYDRYEEDIPHLPKNIKEEKNDTDKEGA